MQILNANLIMYVLLKCFGKKYLSKLQLQLLSKEGSTLR